MLRKRPSSRLTQADFDLLDQAIDQLVADSPEIATPTPRPNLLPKPSLLKRGRVFDITAPQATAKPALRPRPPKVPVVLDTPELLTAHAGLSYNEQVAAEPEAETKPSPNATDEIAEVDESPVPAATSQTFLPSASTAPAARYKADSDQSAMPVFDINRNHPPLLPATTRPAVPWALISLLAGLILATALGFVLVQTA